MKQAIILLGSNLDNRLDYLRKGIHLLKSQKIEVISISNVYESSSFGYDSKNKYLNLAIRINFKSTPLQLLEHCLSTEDKLDRTRDSKIRYSDRTIDIDLILIDQDIIATERLTVPHPRMHERLFCLKPIQDIAPNWIIPTFAITINEALKNLKETSPIIKINVKI